ncbi:MAG: helix-turn-helix domain-containing protein [Chloroflexota bacterium]
MNFRSGEKRQVRQRVRMKNTASPPQASAEIAEFLPSLAGHVDVGRRLRELRLESGYSLRALADISGLNVNTLSLIENNKTSPSVSTLQQLANSLGVPIVAFFESTLESKNIVFQKAGERPRASFLHGVFEDLGAGITLHGGQPLLVHLEAGADSGPTPIVHTGIEFVYCLEGCLHYKIGDEHFDLEPGDSLIFEAHLPHRWGNAGSTPTRSLLIICPSDVKDRPTERHLAPHIG